MKWFKAQEFACPCCNQAKMQPEFIQLLDKAREAADTPFVITSGYRCAKNNYKVGGNPESSHIKGWAADIAVTNDRQRYQILSGLLAVGFNRIGIYEHHIHVDNDPDKPANVVWYGTY